MLLTVMVVLLVAGVDVARAHTGHAVGGGFPTGFTHPLFGLDHLVAMLAVGIWGATLSRRAMWALPVVFPLVMVAGALLGIAGVPVPAVETGIAASALVLGLLVALALRPPLWIAAVVVGVFALFHGHAHGTELPAGLSAVAYGLGFVVATALLHGAGIAIGQVARLPQGALLVRCAGGAVACLGAAFLLGWL